MTKEQLEGLKEGDRLLWTELRGTVGKMRGDGYTNVKFDGSTSVNNLDPGTVLLAQIEEPVLTGADVLRMLADGRRPEEFEWHAPSAGWAGLGFAADPLQWLLDPEYQFRVKP